MNITLRIIVVASLAIGFGCFGLGVGRLATCAIQQSAARPESGSRFWVGYSDDRLEKIGYISTPQDLAYQGSAFVAIGLSFIGFACGLVVTHRPTESRSTSR
jgi:hypothetical protein